MADGFSMNAGGGMGRAMLGGLNGLDQVNGFPMEYEMQAGKRYEGSYGSYKSPARCQHR